MQFVLMCADDELSAYYAEKEPLLLANDAVMQELEQAGAVSIRTLQSQLGVSEGEAAFLSRTFNRKHGDRAKADTFLSQQWSAAKSADKDAYLYHVTTKRRLRLIQRQGLAPGSEAQFTNYRGYSSDRVFLCEKGGVAFWKERVEQHEHANRDRTSRVIVLRVDRRKVPDLKLDKVGTSDSGHPSFYIEQPIAPEAVEVTKL